MQFLQNILIYITDILKKLYSEVTAVQAIKHHESGTTHMNTVVHCVQYMCCICSTMTYSDVYTVFIARYIESVKHE